ncbi:hypothetical protein BBJ28_00009037, partial [Nothophytophthora sp. Chile5]
PSRGRGDVYKSYALGAAVASCWAAAATRHAKTALIATLVWVAKEFMVRAAPQAAALSPAYDDVFDEFDAVFESKAPAVRSVKLRPKINSPEVESRLLVEPTEEKEAPDDHQDNNNNNSHEEDEVTSCATDSTDLLSDLDGEYELLPKPEENREFYADTDCNKTEGERLLQLASSISDTSMRVEEYIRNSTNHEATAQAVDQFATEASENEKESITRILRAFAAYSDEVNYSSDLVSTAEECLQVWQGDEDRAFKSLTVLCNDVPRLCAELS